VDFQARLLGLLCMQNMEHGRELARLLRLP